MEIMTTYCMVIQMQIGMEVPKTRRALLSREIQPYSLGYGVTNIPNKLADIQFFENLTKK